MLLVGMRNVANSRDLGLDVTATGGEEESNEPVVNLEIGGRGEEVVVPSLRMLQQRSPVASASAPAMSNMYPQQYCLRWKYHHSNLQTMFSQLLERQAYCDVTLACEGKTLRAHKVIVSLSLLSPFSHSPTHSLVRCPTTWWRGQCATLQSLSSTTSSIQRYIFILSSVVFQFFFFFS